MLRKLNIRWVPVLFLLPSVICYLLFKYYPLLNMAYISFFDYSIVNPPGKFIGFDNYIEFLKSATFWQAISNTFIFFVLYLTLTFWIPIVQALFLYDIKKGNAFFRFMYQMPTIMPLVGGVLVWKWMYNPDFGLLNYWLDFIGLGPYLWLNDATMTKLAIVLPAVFAGNGISLLLYYSALKSIPTEILEAAKMDGAGSWRRMWTMLLPNIKFIIIIQFIAFMSSVLLAYDNIYIMTQGGPAGSTTVVSMLVVNSAFQQSRFGVSGAISVFMFIVIAVLTIIQNKISAEKD
ncbi:MULTISPECIES: carbohydrate ABC transporter permease [Paenibacillus]|uniref:carbohydrate ABC transporter permease n=1 Tax=Paenibacillus TaxID=44249 RepID=UPI0001AFD8ED|nr:MULTISPECIES: sugar ABC transporter permease [unclassified Paenibacillus]EES72569.1 ABC transporter, permease protein [Paenibacillus sp. oral taxon 786 str. D14]OXL87523.1 ABC transporter permease [Paenibacillus sp. SSG-1]